MGAAFEKVYTTSVLRCSQENTYEQAELMEYQNKISIKSFIISQFGGQITKYIIVPESFKYIPR